MGRVRLLLAEVIATLVSLKELTLEALKSPVMKPRKVGVEPPFAGAILNWYVVPGTHPLEGVYAAPVLSATRVRGRIHVR